jgi:hypothetical protein
MAPEKIGPGHVEPDVATAVMRHQLIEAVQTASDQRERVTLRHA